MLLTLTASQQSVDVFLWHAVKSHIMLTVDVWYTNAALPRISGLAFVTDDIAKMLKKMQRILFTMDSSG